ncbi:MetQ/NlpA family ABC transporter substrate-binding protein [Campylobacter cuniculorum]|uniref:MetQ/NlpA family ABC transporter substrate-binding protein n=1 Tax=Campylobacter cuniculorum TaxID=374106 RepID=UPI0023F4FEC7|nr:MetQ/NlpA family ABC transporter substrate-binding protein [Campylobacter cuniculorum]
MKMYKIFLVLVFCFNLLLANDKTIIIGATPTPHAEILHFAKSLFKDRGWNLEVKEFTDYILPNIALSEKELDANFYQHQPFLDDFNKNKNTHLISVENVLLVPMAIYSRSIKSIKEVPNGIKVSIPNDPTNESRALELLEKTGLIKLNDNALKTPLDIVDNPKKLEFVELKAAQLPRALEDTPLAIIPTNYALGAGLNPPKDGLFIEDKDSPYAIVIAVRKGDENNEKTKIIKELLHSPKIKEFIEQKYQGSVIPTF